MKKIPTTISILLLGLGLKAQNNPQIVEFTNVQPDWSLITVDTNFVPSPLDRFPTKYYNRVINDIKLDKNPNKDECAQYSQYKKEIFSLVPAGGYWRNIDQNIAKDYMKSCWYMEGGRTGILRRMSLDEPSLTVLTSPSQKQTERCHPLEARPFTVRENARCQTFPDEWQFCGSVQSQYKQVGNAVPVNLAYEIGLEIHKSLEGIK